MTLATVYAFMPTTIPEWHDQEHSVRFGIHVGQVHRPRLRRAALCKVLRTQKETVAVGYFRCGLAGPASNPIQAVVPRRRCFQVGQKANFLRSGTHGRYEYRTGNPPCTQPSVEKCRRPRSLSPEEGVTTHSAKPRDYQPGTLLDFGYWNNTMPSREGRLLWVMIDTPTHPKCRVNTSLGSQIFAESPRPCSR